MERVKESTAQARTVGLWCFGLFLATYLVFAGAAGHEFVSYDDDLYVTANPAVQAGLTAPGLRWAFTTDHAANWHPLTWLSHMADVERFGLDPAGHHRTSIFLHALTAALLLRALWRLSGAPWASLFAAALFALHPLRVESVAWVAERKDVLAGLFAVGTLIAYASYVRNRGRARFLVVYALFTLGLLAKPMLVTLPFVLLLLDRWPLARTESTAHLVREKAPLLLLAVASCVVTVIVQRAGGALDPLETLPLGARLANAGVAVVTYVGQTLWPVGLACYYPHPGILSAAGTSPWSVPALAALALVLAACVVAARLHRRAPWLFVGWFWFLGMLVPVLGLVQVGVQAHADRYTYLPSIGLAVIAAFGLRALVAARPATRAPAVAAAGLWILALLPLTLRQVRTWRDTETLFTHALAVTDANYLAHNNLGSELERAGDHEGAAEQYRLSLAARPGVAAVHYNLAVVSERRGDRATALAELRRAIELAPDYPQALTNLGILLSSQGDDAEAERNLTRAWQLDPQLLPAAQALIWLLATSPEADVRDGARAAELARACLARVRAAPLGLREAAAAAFAAAGDFERAASLQREVLEAVPAAARDEVGARLRAYEQRRPHVKSP